jgi:flagellar basal-body rod modification protein FlgD
MTSITPSTIADIRASQASSSKTIAGNFTTFLSLLTTQLQNQNPLDPLDTNQFTQQLVQFTGVEQMLKTNDLLATLLEACSAGSAASAANYIGKSVTADGSATTLADGKAQWSWTAPRAAAKATISVLDKAGATVYSATQAIGAGAGAFTWDGHSDTGTMFDGGEFTLKIDAKDASGQPVAISTEVKGTVDGVDLTGSEVLLKVGALSVPLSKVKTLALATP